MHERFKQRILWASLALVFLIVAVLFSREDESANNFGDGTEASVTQPPPRFPRALRKKDQAKRQKAPRQRTATRDGGTPKIGAVADPLMAALALPDQESTIFVEVNALRHSPLVERLLRCRSGEPMEALDRMREDLGIDLLKDVDRIGLGDDVLAVSGFFDQMKMPDGVESLGQLSDGTELFGLQDPDRGTPYFVAKSGNNLLVTGSDRQAVESGVARAEGRAPADVGTLPNLVGSEVYGRVSGGFIGQLLGGSDDPVARKLASMVENADMQLLVDHAVSLSLDLDVRDASEGKDLATAVGGALAGMRLAAREGGEEDLGRLLEYAAVLPREDGSFGVDLALPGEALLEAAGCFPEAKAP